MWFPGFISLRYCLVREDIVSIPFGLQLFECFQNLGRVVIARSRGSESPSSLESLAERARLQLWTPLVTVYDAVELLSHLSSLSLLGYVTLWRGAAAERIRAGGYSPLDGSKRLVNGGLDDLEVASSRIFVWNQTNARSAGIQSPVGRERDQSTAGRTRNGARPEICPNVSLGALRFPAVLSQWRISGCTLRGLPAVVPESKRQPTPPPHALGSAAEYRHNRRAADCRISGATRRWRAGSGRRRDSGRWPEFAAQAVRPRMGCCRLRR